MNIWRGLKRLGKRLRWPIRSAGLNFALAYGLVFIISAGVFLSFIWWNTTGQLDRQVQADVQVDAHDLAQRGVHGGPAALALAITERPDQNVEDDELTLLVGPEIGSAQGRSDG